MCVLHELWVCHIKWPLCLTSFHHPIIQSNIRSSLAFIRLANIKILSKSTKTKTKVSHCAVGWLETQSAVYKIARRWQSSVLSINVDWGVTISSWESRYHGEREREERKEDLNHLCRYIKWNKVWITASVEQHLSSIAPFLAPAISCVCVCVYVYNDNDVDNVKRKGRK
jgi:hypothetical protein